MLVLTKSVFLMYCQRFFCGGRLIFGPDVASLFLSTLLIAGPGIGFCLKIHYKIKEDDDDYGRRFAHHVVWYSIMAVGAFLTILVSNVFSLCPSAVITSQTKKEEEFPLEVNYKKCSPGQMTSIYSVSALHHNPSLIKLNMEYFTMLCS